MSYPLFSVVYPFSVRDLSLDISVDDANCSFLKSWDFKYMQRDPADILVGGVEYLQPVKL